MNRNPFNSACWIGTQSGCESPIIMKKFHLDKLPESSVLYITSLGFFEARVNGKKVTEYKFLPVQTDFEKRKTENFLYPIHDEFTHRVYYYEFNVKSLLAPGENTLEIHLGNGWYHQSERNIEGDMRFATDLKTIYRLDCDGVSINSDGCELWRESEIRYNNLFTGEVHDKTFVTEREEKVDIFPAPETLVCKAIGTPDKIIRTITPTLICTKDGKNVYDAGKNISGVVRVYTKGQRGEKIILTFAENLNDDLSLDYKSTGVDYTCRSGCSQLMRDTFICSGNEEIFEPKCVWHAFRYFDIEGSADKLEVLVVHSDCDITSSFSSSSEGLNFLYDAFIRTQLDNMHGSIPSDCPHRERLGYTGDGQLCAKPAMLFLDTREFYRKWMQDILDCQDIKSGHVQHTAPFMGGGGGPGGWGCAIVFVPFEFYKQFGETETLSAYYEPMRRWIDYLKTRLEGNLITSEERDGWCLGDWCTLEKLEMPAAFVNTCLFVKALRIFSRITKILNKSDDLCSLKKLDQDLCDAIKMNFLSADGHYCNGANGADLFAYDIGLLSDAVMDEVANSYKRNGCINTGILGTPLLFDALFAKGLPDIALSLYESEILGSFLYMKRRNATTLWETWDGKGSHNHPMFGACVSHLFTSILGCTQPEDCFGYKKVVIKPQFPQGLDFAKGELNTVNGKIKLSYKRTGDFVSYDIKIAKAIEASFTLGNASFPLNSQNPRYAGENFEVQFDVL